MTTEPKQNHSGFRQSQKETGESNSPGLENSDGSMTAKCGQCQGKEKGHTIKTRRTKTSEKSKTAEINEKSQEKSGESCSPGLEDSHGSMTAKHGQSQGKKKGHTIKTRRTNTNEKSKTAEINEKSQEKKW